MSTGFPGAHRSWLSPCEKDPSHTKTTGNPPVQKVHRKACNTAKGETKIQESEICTSISMTIFTVQLEQRCFRCFGVWELLWRKKIKETGAALCEYELVAESFYFSLFPKLGWTEFTQRNTPSTYGGSSQGDQHRQPHKGIKKRPRETPPTPFKTLPPNKEWITQSLPHVGPSSNACGRLAGCSTWRARSWAYSHQGVNRGGISNTNNLNFICNS